jgi:hypothetical protein
MDERIVQWQSKQSAFPEALERAGEAVAGCTG